MKPDYGRIYGDLYQEHWWWRAREVFIQERLRRHSFNKEGHVLDIGCGDGLAFRFLAEFGIVQGIEPNAMLISQNNPHRNNIHIGPFDQNFQPNRLFSLIVLLDVLEHLDDPQSALTRVSQLLEPYGVVCITVPAFLSLWTAHDDVNLHQTRYRKKVLLDLASRCGLQIEQAHYFFHWLFPVKLLIRGKQTILPPQTTNPRIPPGPVNRFFYGICRLEQHLFRQLPLPFGSSLLLLGRNTPRPDSVGTPIPPP